VGRQPFRPCPTAHTVTLVLVLLVYPGIAHADVQLVGTVKSVEGRPRPGVSVEIMGPKTVYTETDASGDFSVKLVPGTYVFRVRDGTKRMEFERQIGPNDTKLELRLKW
jgi:hypothetical protein